MNKIPWGPIRSLLSVNFTFSGIKEIVGYANIDMSQLAHLEQKDQQGASKSQLLSAIDAQIGRMDANRAAKVVSICCEEMLRKNRSLIGELDYVLSRFGWKFSGTTLLPIEIFDISELAEIPDEAHDDIQKAASRLRDGDLSGALSASCGALDSVTESIYQGFGLGEPHKASFQERIKKSLSTIGTKENLQRELLNIGWSESDITLLSNNLDGALSQAAYVMQKLRSHMGDVHGTKPIVSALIYDSIKWSLLLLRMLVTPKSL